MVIIVYKNEQTRSTNLKTLFAYKIYKTRDKRNLIILWLVRIGLFHCHFTTQQGYYYEIVIIMTVTAEQHCQLHETSFRHATPVLPHTFSRYQSVHKL